MMWTSALDRERTASVERRMMLRQHLPESSQVFLGRRTLGQLATGPRTDLLRHFKGWVFAAVQPIAKRISAQPLHVARRIDERPAAGRRRTADAKHVLPWVRARVKQSGDLEMIEDHPLLDWISDPNPLMISQSLWYVVVVNLVVTGKAFVMITEEDGDRLQFWPVPTSWVTAKRSRTKLIDHWEVSAAAGVAGQRVEVEDMLYFHIPDPGDPVFGALSPVQAMRESVQADESIQEAQRAIFRNGVFPGLAFFTGQVRGPNGELRMPEITPKRRRELVDYIREHFGGVEQMGEPMVLDAVISDAKELMRRPVDMDFRESSKLTKSRIVQTVGTNPIVMGEIEGANRASALAAEKHLCNETVNPLVTLISQVLTKQLGGRPGVTVDGERLMIWLEQCVADDVEQVRANYQAMASYSAVSKNEMRAALEDLPPLEQGDVVVQPATAFNVPVGRRSKQAANGHHKTNGRFVLR